MIMIGDGAIPMQACLHLSMLCIEVSCMETFEIQIFAGYFHFSLINACFVKIRLA